MRASDDIYTALNRFGLGARPADAQSGLIAKNWLRAQLSAKYLTRPAPRGGFDLTQLGDIMMQMAPKDREMRKQGRKAMRKIYRREALGLLTQQVRSETPFLERWIAFWSNHLCVSAAKNARVAVYAGAYERQAIRRHALGRFEDLLLASARHPAMLLYLDNTKSIGPNSRAGLRRGRGLNENYARELFELHTLGVNGGYDLHDIQALAAIFSGWSVTGRRHAQPGQFIFRRRAHEPGTHTVLGRRYREAGITQGEAVIRDLARHPATARHLARKLAQHFVSDSPPAPLVNALAQSFSRSGGNLKALAETLIEHPAAWTPDARKFKTPHDFVVSLMRGMALTSPPRQALTALRSMDQMPWRPKAPKGYSSRQQDWAHPQALLHRAEIAKQAVDGDDMLEPPEKLGAALLGPGFRGLLAELVRDAGDDGAAVLFASPAFQWRS